jgi:hypothetical protein
MRLITECLPKLRMAHARLRNTGEPSYRGESFAV